MAAKIEPSILPDEFLTKFAYFMTRLRGLKKSIKLSERLA